MTDQAEALRRLVIQTSSHEPAVCYGNVILVHGTRSGCGTSKFARQLALAIRRQTAAAWIEIRRGSSDVSARPDTLRQPVSLSQVLRQERILSEAWSVGPGGLRTLTAQLPDDDHVTWQPLLDQLRRAARQQQVVVDVQCHADLLALLPAADHCVFVAAAESNAHVVAYQAIKRAADSLRAARCWLVVNQFDAAPLTRQLAANVVLTCDRCLNLCVDSLGTLPWVDESIPEGAGQSADRRDASAYRDAVETVATQLTLRPRRRSASTAVTISA